MTDGKDPETGRFTSGNRFWEARTSFAMPKMFEAAVDLRAAVTEYFDWNDANPLMSAELVKFEGKASLAELPKMRAMTLQGLFMFLGINPKTWWDWRQNRDDLADVIQWAEAVIYRQKFEGAAADMLNQAIIARELGLVDKQATEHTGKDGGPIQTEEVTRSADDFARRMGGLATRTAGGGAEPST
jgi:hypothetical protein